MSRSPPHERWPSHFSIPKPRQIQLYLALLVLRLVFAVQPSYLHPDEHYQSLAPFAARFFPSWNSAGQITWEWNQAKPIRSVVVLWPLLGGLMRGGEVLGGGPGIIFYASRFLWFVLSLCVDIVIYQLSPNPYLSLLLYASSYTTLVYQTHTFTNGIEALFVLLTLRFASRRSVLSSTPHIAFALGASAVLGTFVRITFPGWILPSIFSALPTVSSRPRTFVLTALGALAAFLVALTADTLFFHGSFRAPVLTPLHNLAYNTDTANLAHHGLHPRWTHLLVNLPLLLGPAVVLLKYVTWSVPLLCAASGIAALSAFPHQEARFVLPAVPLILTAVGRLPARQNVRVAWIATWIAFNVILAGVFGVVHQGGVVPALLRAGHELERCHIPVVHDGASASIDTRLKHVWWKTYSPPTWLMGERGSEVDVWNMRGAAWDEVASTLVAAPTAAVRVNAPEAWCARTLLFAPLSARPFIQNSTHVQLPSGGHLKLIAVERWHIGFDDLDVEEEGLVGTLRRNVGRMGLGIWAVVY